MISGPVLEAIQSILAEDSICPDKPDPPDEEARDLKDSSNNTSLIDER